MRFKAPILGVLTWGILKTSNHNSSGQEDKQEKQATNPDRNTRTLPDRKTRAKALLSKQEDKQ